MLGYHVIPQLRENGNLDSVIFQHDSAPPHFSTTTARDYLREVFTEERIIGRGFKRQWPPRPQTLLHLIILRGGFWNLEFISISNPQTLKQLKSRIEHVCREWSQSELERSILHLPIRLRMVLENGGNVFEHVLCEMKLWAITNSSFFIKRYISNMF